jgi:hypothetical protein
VWHANAVSHTDISSEMDVGSHETCMSEQPVVQRKLASLWQWCGKGGRSFIGAKRAGDYGHLPGYRTGFRTAIMGCVLCLYYSGL